MATATSNSLAEAPSDLDRKEMSPTTDAVNKEEEGEDGSFSDYHIDPVKESRMMRKFDV